MDRITETFGLFWTAASRTRRPRGAAMKCELLALSQWFAFVCNGLQ